jgi:hypothetical protein
LLIAVALACGTLGCTSKPRLDIRNSPIGYGVGDPSPAIEAALADRGWQVVGRGPGMIDAAILVRQHRADIRITYDARSYSIGYRGSEMLDARGDRIHRNYNRWVANLDRSIQQRLLHGGRPTDGPR